MYLADPPPVDAWLGTLAPCEGTAHSIHGMALELRKRDDLNIQVHSTIFSKYLALPVATFPSYESRMV